MKEYCKKNVFKEKATLARREKEPKKGTTGATYLEFMATLFTPKINAFHIKTRKIKTTVAADLGKIYAGVQDFLPKAQSFRDIIKFW